MKGLRKALLISLAVAVLISAGLLEAFNLLAARHRDQVKHELQKILGQDVSFEHLEVNLIGPPGFSAKEFRIADDSRFAATPVVRARALVLGVSLWNLLWRRLVITSLTFDEPEFQIITDESGLLNLTALVNRKAELRKFPRLRSPGSGERRGFPLSFAITELRVKRGRIDYVDRSIKQPAELRIGNVAMSIRGFELHEPTRIQLAAALTEGLGQDVRIQGLLTPARDQRNWLQRNIDLNVQFDSLYVPLVARAIAALRDKIPAELDVTGPMALEVRVRGTAERPRLENISLKVPLFGSSEYNAIISGAVHFTERRSWEDAELKGKAAIKPLPLVRLRSLRTFAQLLPAELISEGSVNIASRFEGTWENLRLGALVEADAAELRYHQWFHKTTAASATIRARIWKVKHELRFGNSELVLGNNKTGFSGILEAGPVPRLRMRFHNHGGSASSWGRFFSLPLFEAQGGKVEMDLTVAKGWVADGGDWRLFGKLGLSDATLLYKTAGRKLENLRGEIVFGGKQARFENVGFRMGSSVFFVDGTVPDMLDPRFRGSIRSPEVFSADIPVLGTNPTVRLKQADSVGELYFGSDGWMLTATLTSREGHLSELPVHELRADVVLSTEGLIFKNARARTLNGQLHLEGRWAAAENGGRLEFSCRIDGVETRALLARLFPPLRDRFQGPLFGQGSFQVNGTDDPAVNEPLKGFGHASVQQGTLKDFNLLSQLLLKGSGTTVSAASTARLSPGLAALARQPDTTFESLKANFTIEHKRVVSNELVFTTPEYMVTAAGWIGFDRSTKWNGSLLLSSQLTQEVQRDYRIIRYLLDRRGRLPISFRVDGKVPNVTVRLENRALAQALRSGNPRKDGDGGADSGTGETWLPDALERLLRGG